MVHVMFRNYLLVLLLGVSSISQLFSEPEYAILTIPKGGTYLSRKLVTLIGDDPNHIVDHLNEKNVKLPWVYENRKIIILIRDPRDILVSQINWIREGCTWWPTGYYIPNYFQNLTYSDQIFWMINFPKEHIGLKEYLEWAREVIENKHATIIKFEDLIGTNGGGNSTLQLNAISSLLELLGYEYSEERVAKIASSLFGGTETFRKGNIGNWKKHFKNNHKVLFEEKFGEFLRYFDYEKDGNW